MQRSTNATREYNRPHRPSHGTIASKNMIRVTAYSVHGLRCTLSKGCSSGSCRLYDTRSHCCFDTCSLAFIPDCSMDALDSLVDFARFLSKSSLSATPTSNEKIQHTITQNSCTSRSLQLGPIATPATQCYVRDAVGSATRVHSPATTHDASSATYSGCEYNATSPRSLENHNSYMSYERGLIQNQDRKMECITCTWRDLDCRFAPPWTRLYPMKSLACGDYGTNISHQYPYAPHYVNEADVFTFYGGGRCKHCSDGRCICRATVPIHEHTMESCISGIINDDYIQEKEDVWMMVNLTDERLREV
jgi:hypothetical protein